MPLLTAAAALVLAFAFGSFAGDYPLPATGSSSTLTVQTELEFQGDYYHKASYVDAFKFIRAGEAVNVKNLWNRDLYRLQRDNAHRVGFPKFAKNIKDALEQPDAIFHITPTPLNRSSILHTAVHKAKPDCVRLLLESKFVRVLNVRDGDGASAMDLAEKIAIGEYKEEIKAMLARYPVVEGVRLGQCSHYLRSFIANFIDAMPQATIDQLQMQVGTYSKRHLNKNDVKNKHRPWIIYKTPLIADKRDVVAAASEATSSMPSRFDEWLKVPTTSSPDLIQQSYLRTLHYYAAERSGDAIKAIREGRVFTYLRQVWGLNYLQRQSNPTKLKKFSDDHLVKLIMEYAQRADAVFSFTPTPTETESLLHKAARSGRVKTVEALLKTPFVPVLNMKSALGKLPIELVDEICDQEVREKIRFYLSRLAKPEYQLGTSSGTRYLGDFIKSFIDNMPLETISRAISEKPDSRRTNKYVRSDHFTRKQEEWEWMVPFPEECLKIEKHRLWAKKHNDTNFAQHTDRTSVSVPITVNLAQLQVSVPAISPLTEKTTGDEVLVKKTFIDSNFDLSSKDRKTSAPEIVNLAQSQASVPATSPVTKQTTPAKVLEEKTFIDSIFDLSSKGRKTSAPEYITLDPPPEQSLNSTKPLVTLNPKLPTKRPRFGTGLPPEKFLNTGGARVPKATKTPSCKIDRKYLGLEDNALKINHLKNNPSMVLEGTAYELSLIFKKGADKAIVHAHNFANNDLTLLSMQSLEQFSSSKRITFVRNGRGAQSYIPNELNGGRIVLVMPKADSLEALELVDQHTDVLLINAAPSVEEKDLGLAGVRWWAALQTGIILGLPNFMLMDDNIRSVHTKDTPLDSWQQIYQLFQNVANQQNVAVVSSSSFRPEHCASQLSKSTMIAKINRYGYKLFYINGNALREVFQSARNLIPPHLTWALQDIFLQEVVRQAGLGIAKISSESLLIKRSIQQQNLCAASYKKRNISGLSWIDVDANSYPMFYQLGCKHIGRLVEKSLSFYEKEDAIARTVDLVKAFAPDSVSQIAHAKPTEFLETSSRQLLHESLQLVDRQTLRQPQREAVSQLEKFLGTPSTSHQAYFDMPTGAGKTLIFNSIASAYRRHINDQRLLARRPHVLIVTPTIELGAQTLQNNLPSDGTIIINSRNISQKNLLINEEFRSLNSNPKIVIICKKSLKKLLDADLNRQIMDRFGLVIIDEMHLVSKEVLEDLKNYTDQVRTPMLGFSATPNKTKNFFGHLVYKYDTIQAVRDGFLVPWKLKYVEQDAFKDFEHTAQSIQTILDRLTAPDGSFNHRGIIWVKNQELANDLYARVTQKNPGLSDSIATYHAGIKNRFAVLSDFRAGRYKILVAVQTLKEGFDDREIDFAIITRRVKLDQFIQMLGRVLRVSENNPSKIAKVFLTIDGIKDEQPHPFCPIELINKRKTLPTTTWKPIPFPFGTDLEAAIRYSQQMIERDHHSNIFRAVNDNIYKSSNPSACAEYYRFTTHYVPTANPDAASLSALYYHQFVANKNKPVTADPPSIKIYEEERSPNGQKHYRLLSQLTGSEQKIKFLKVQRKLFNHRTKINEMIDHYELLWPLP